MEAVSVSSAYRQESKNLIITKYLPFRVALLLVLVLVVFFVLVSKKYIFFLIYSFILFMIVVCFFLREPHLLEKKLYINSFFYCCRGSSTVEISWTTVSQLNSRHEEGMRRITFHDIVDEHQGTYSCAVDGIGMYNATLTLLGKWPANEPYKFPYLTYFEGERVEERGEERKIIPRNHLCDFRCCPLHTYAYDQIIFLGKI